MLFAPGLKSLSDIRRVVVEVGAPVNVLIMPGTPNVAELADAGVSRVSVGGAFAFAALGAMVEAACELLVDGTCGYWQLASFGVQGARAAFGDAAARA